METNENVKKVNENIQDVQANQYVQNVQDVQVNQDIQSMQNIDVTEDIRNCENTINSGGVETTLTNNMEATQRIVILKELIQDTENSKQEFLEGLSAQKTSSQDAKNVENLNQENQESLEQSVLDECSFAENKNENTHNENLQCGLNNIQETNPQENVINEINNLNVSNQNINNQNVIGQNVNSKNVNSQNTSDKNINNQENIVKAQEESNEEKDKRHKQDKKDYRLERMLFDRINTMQGKIKESLELIKKFERINAREENLPNIVTTLHDKLTQEVIKQFRTVGIEFNMKSYLVQSIVSDLLNKFEEGITEFRDCSENLNFVREVQDDFESRVELVSTSKVKNLIARLRGVFKPERKQEKLQQLERERQEKKLEEANIHLIKYKFKNSELEKYTIKNNIVNSLTREILTGPGSGLSLTVAQFIEQKIAPEMNKLGLIDLLPQLEDSLLQEYKDKQPYTLKEELLKMQVGEVKRNVKTSKLGYICSKVNLINSNSLEEEEKMVV